MKQTTLFHQDLKWQHTSHVLALRWDEFRPSLIITRNDSTPGSLELHPDDGLAMDISNEKHCVGRMDNTRIVQCPNHARVTRYQRCDECSDPHIPDQRCIFEPRCQGASCLVEDHLGESIEFCSRPHVVYLAFYGGSVKIGLSSGRRIRKRCIEQGADAFAVIAHAENRYQGRSIEKQLGREFGIRQSYSNHEFLRIISRKVKAREISERYREMTSSLNGNPLAEVGDLELLEGFPIDLPLRSIPRETTTPGLHMGKIYGIKGRFLIYESGGLSALNISDIPSRMISYNPAPYE